MIFFVRIKHLTDIWTFGWYSGFRLSFKIWLKNQTSFFYFESRILSLQSSFQWWKIKSIFLSELSIWLTLEIFVGIRARNWFFSESSLSFLLDIQADLFYHNWAFTYIRTFVWHSSFYWWQIKPDLFHKNRFSDWVSSFWLTFELSPITNQTWYSNFIWKSSLN